jgi:hypothetical protein
LNPPFEEQYLRAMTTQAPSGAEVEAGHRVYSPLVLAGFDVFVIRFSNRFAWRCPWPLQLAAYDRHVGARHLDVGVGTGFYLDRCRWPVELPEITLVDLNPNSLRAAARRIRRFEPRTLQANVLEPFELGDAPYASIGLNFLLHCLPGPIEAKTSAVLHTLRPHLAPGGVLFGSTILGRGVRHNALGRRLQAVYNRRGIFSNLDDDREGLERALGAMADVEVQVVGAVALFSARAHDTAR